MTRVNNIGILLPQSNAYPFMGKSFMNGIRLALKNKPVHFLVESIGFGSNPTDILNAYQKLTIQNEIDLTTGLFGHSGFLELANFAAENNEILIAASLGATKTQPVPKGVFQNSLDLYNALTELAFFLSEKNNKSIATSSCYYESGYGFIKALDLALNQIKSAQFVGHYITPLNPRQQESEIMNLAIEEMKPDAIIAFHNSIFAKEHAEYLSENKLYEKHPVYCLPFSAEDQLVKDFPSVFKKIKTISSWYPDLANQHNQTFVFDYGEKTGKKPDFFALLGYENGLIINAALNQKNSSLVTNLEKTNIDGPRGNISFNQTEQKTSFKNYIWEQYLDADQKVKRTQNETLELNTINTNNKIINTQGWHNSYLCH